MDDAFIAPKPIHYTETGPRTARFVIEPLNPGYGMTLGNPLRRILLSSLEGHAVSSIILPKVTHEFSTLENVKEDMVEIILNIKQARFRVTGVHEYPIRLTLTHKGEGVVKASEFTVPAGVEVVSPDAVIATTTAPGAEFEMTAMLSKGRGFNPVEVRDQGDQEIGTISIDAIYTPVRHVSFSIENVRVGQMTNYNRVILDVETDGSISPREAMEQAIKIFQDHTRSLVWTEEEAPVATMPTSENEAPAEEPAASAGLDEAAGDEMVADAEEGSESGEVKEKAKRGRKKKSDKL